MIPNFSSFYQEINGKPSMAAVLTQSWDLMPKWKPWAEITQVNAHRDFRDVILPLFKDFAMEEYTVPMIQERFELLQIRETIRFGNGSIYAPNTLRHFKYLIKRVYEVAAMTGICPNILWGTTFTEQHKRNKDEIEVEVRAMLHKSLMPNEEYNLETEVFRDPMQIGERMFALLAWALGGRPQEISDLQYSDIMPVDVGNGRYVMAVITTVDGDHSKLGGKSKAMFRFVPISKRLYRFLMARKHEIKKWLADNEDDPQIKELNIDDLYICCEGNNYAKRCNVRKASNVCRDILRNIGISETVMRYYDEQSKGDVDLTVWGIEKEVTTYLLRRNFATKLFHLGLEMDEVLYLMGHSMKDCVHKRSDYRNTDKMNVLFDKLKYRAIFNPLPDWDKQAITIRPGHKFTTRKNVPEVCVRYDSKSPSGKIILYVTPNEANDQIIIEAKIKTTDGETATLYGKYESDEAHGERRDQINVLSDYVKMYASEEAKRPWRKESFQFLDDDSSYISE